MRAYEQCANPDRTYSAAAFWFLNGRLDKDRLIEQMDEMKEQGVYQAFLHPRAYLVTPYLEKEWWDAIGACVEHAARTGFLSWLYDEYAWPSGTAGSTFEFGFQKPSRVLAQGRVNMAKSARLTDAPEADERLLFTYFVPLDASGAPQIAKAQAQPPEQGAYREMVLVEHVYPRCVDYMNPDAIRLFLDLTHEEYKKRYGAYFGESIDTTTLDWTDYEPLAPLEGPTGLRQSAARFGGNFNLVGMISTQCEHSEIAFKLLDFMIGEEGTYFGHYGVEGISYEWVDSPSFYGSDKSIVRLMTDKETLWNSGSFPRADREEVRYATTMDPEQVLVDNTYILVHAAQTYEPYYVNHNIPDIVWCADEDVTLAVSEYATLINEYIKTMDTQFVMGTLDINDDAQWQAYLDELDAMGLQDYIAQMEVYYNLK